jgi:hypothetical protein
MAETSVQAVVQRLLCVSLSFAMAGTIPFTEN